MRLVVVAALWLLPGCDDRTAIEQKYDASSEKIAGETKALDAEITNAMEEAEGNALPAPPLR